MVAAAERVRRTGLHPAARGGRGSHGPRADRSRRLAGSALASPDAPRQRSRPGSWPWCTPHARSPEEASAIRPPPSTTGSMCSGSAKTRGDVHSHGCPEDPPISRPPLSGVPTWQSDTHWSPSWRERFGDTSRPRAPSPRGQPSSPRSRCQTSSQTSSSGEPPTAPQTPT